MLVEGEGVYVVWLAAEKGVTLQNVKGTRGCFPPQYVLLNQDGSLTLESIEGFQVTLTLLKPFNVKKDLDTISITWSIEDVHGATENSLTDEQARGVLLFVKKHQNSTEGLTWGGIQIAAQHLYGYEG